jgi:hypothetical protein
MNHMRDEPTSVQRSFRLSKRTVELLDAASAAGRESRNALADRLLGEAVRLERHPLIRFHESASGRRQPLVVGTRLYVHQVMSTVRASDGDVDEAGNYLLRPEELAGGVSRSWSGLVVASCSWRPGCSVD